MALTRLDTEHFSDVEVAAREIANDVENLKTLIATSKSIAMQNWVGGGRDEFSNLCYAVERQMKDISEEFWSVYDALVDAEGVFSRPTRSSRPPSPRTRLRRRRTPHPRRPRPARAAAEERPNRAPRTASWERWAAWRTPSARRSTAASPGPPPRAPPAAEDSKGASWPRLTREYVTACATSGRRSATSTPRAPPRPRPRAR